jgi:aspartate/methionine/tyrosine aminotransferase
MSAYADRGAEHTSRTLDVLRKEYAAYAAMGLDLNMSRGKPASDQLELSLPMLDILSSDSNLHAEGGIDCRNYGVGFGIPEARALMAIMLDDNPENVMVFGNSSLSIMYDELMRCWTFGTLGNTPWNKLDHVRWLCPVPGYDRHFSITEAFGIDMISIPMDDNGPDMNFAEQLVAQDASIKGIWCVPTYSNPGGITYSDEVVRRLASMPCAAPDFRIFWDNAYCVHHLSDDASQQDHVLDIARACSASGTENRCFKFASTSKVTFPGAGVAAMAASAANTAEIKKIASIQMIGHDKLNQLRHVRFLRDAEGIASHMAKHAAIIRPKFDFVINMLEQNLQDTGCSWSHPHGGYFICFQGPSGTAQRIVDLAKEAGVTLTAAGSPFPYHLDPEDSVIRIAPTLPSLDELDKAMHIFVCCAKIACIESSPTRQSG